MRSCNKSSQLILCSSSEMMLSVLCYRAFIFGFIEAFPVPQAGLKFIVLLPPLLLWDKTFPGEMQQTRLLAPDREPMTDQSLDTTKVQLGEPMSFIGFIHKNMSEGLLIGAEMTEKQSPPKLG